MKRDYLYDWWFEERFGDFLTYMKSWRGWVGSTTEDHTDIEICTKRAIIYFDSINKGFIAQYLITKYAMDFIQEVVRHYWNTESLGETKRD